jgi:hypothetical protein
MGLDIHVLKNAKFLRGVSDDGDFDDGHYLSISEHNFVERADGLNPGFYDGEDGLHFRAGSYSGYNHYRDILSRAGMDASADEVWGNRSEYMGKTFWEQVEFSDCEGTIGPKTSAKLAADYNDPKNREKFEKVLKKMYKDHPDERKYYLRLYDDWAKAFTDAAETNGVVIFT